LKSPPGEVAPQQDSPAGQATTGDKLLPESGEWKSYFQRHKKVQPSDENDPIKLTLPPKANPEAHESRIAREHGVPTRHTNSPPVEESRGRKQHNFVFTKACAERQYNYRRKPSELESETETDLDKTNEEIELIDLGINMATLGQLQFEQAQYSR
jgi:hypothetical protein